jgi:hypothetical protein
MVGELISELDVVVISSHKLVELHKAHGPRSYLLWNARSYEGLHERAPGH